MTKTFYFSLMLVLTGVAALAQKKPLVKTDTIKVKTKPKETNNADTTLVRFPLPVKAPKFDKLDSLDLTLTADLPIEKYGSINIADLKMTSCGFEKDANAMVLFDRAEMVLSVPEIILERHKRIKIFNDVGKSEANIRIEYNNKFGAEAIAGIEAETINLNDGKPEYTKLDQKLAYVEHTDKNKDAVVFSMPNVRAGSVIEYRYVLGKEFAGSFPSWDFQCSLPTRYSQLDAFLNPILTFSMYSKTDGPFVKDTVSMQGLGHLWALALVPSTKEEPYMRSPVDELQHLTFLIKSVMVHGFVNPVSKSWAAIGKEIAEYKDFYKPFDQSLHDEGVITRQAIALNDNDKKVAFLFRQVQTAMKWNEDKNWLSKNGTKDAWKKKSGNWSEINMILCRLLNNSGVKAYPMLVSTRDNGKIVPDFTDIHQINKLVVYVPVSNGNFYVLDASDKYNIYNQIPYELLNSYGLYLNREKQDYALVFLKKEEPVRQIVLIDAEINPDGTMKGTAEMSGYSYNKSSSLELYKTLDKKKYEEFLADDDNNLKISSLKITNADVDSLPLIQNLNFTLDLPGTDEKYIYFNPNLFTSLHHNPFVSKERSSDIDFGYCKSFSINGRYKIPAGYKIEALPQSMNLTTPGKSITFKRLIGEQDGYIMINYVINYKKSIFPRSEYPEIYAYFKKMTEILNEQIVLKKT